MAQGDLLQRYAAQNAKLETTLRHIIAMAGNPNAADACRLIINRAEQALGTKRRTEGNDRLQARNVNDR